MGYIILLAVGAILFTVYIWYAGIISKKNRAKEALSGIDVQLKKRNNIIPNILKIAAKFMKHEKELIEQVTKLRSNASQKYDANDVESVKSHLKDVGALDAGLGKLMISVEDYPDLKSDETMLQAQRTYNEVEEHIAASRRFYNSAVTALNNSIEIFPGNIIASLAKAKIMPFYKTDELSKSPIDADKYLS
jgi:LemA protein